MLTITEAAALLTERGMTDRAGGPMRPDSVKHLRAAGAFPNAQRATSGHGAGRYWLIPVEDVEAYAVARGGRRTPGPGKTLGRPRKDTRMITQIWQHATSGERFAVAVDSYGYILGAAGPLHHSEIEQAKTGEWDADWEVLDDIRATQQEYRVVTDRVEA
jgi:hypothetical protein